MKQIFLLIILMLVIKLQAQTLNDKDFYSIVKAEARAASAKMMNNTNLNTGNYDVKYHQLQFNIDPSSTFLSGITTTQFEAKENMTQVFFDLADNMTVTQVLQDGNSVSFTQNSNDELIIDLSPILTNGDIETVEITYSGNPISSGFGSYEQTTHNGDPIIWTLSEPYGAKGWWPCKQDLNDKIDDGIDVYITTPRYNSDNEEYIAVSNGVEQSQTINGTEKTTHFQHSFPIPAYLVAIAATNYQIYSHTVPNNGNPFEIVNYVYPENLASAQASTGVTVDIMELFSNLFEDYPYASEKYGHAQFGWGGGMEHTTVSFMGSFGRELIAHELAHQWFGDKITCGSWKDIWLNEGFATYLSALVIEDFDGDASFKTWRQQRINNITSQPGGAVYLSDQDTTSVGRIFDGRLSYNKGAMVLHMLRKKLGDINFYQGMQDYLSDVNYAFGYAKTPDYQSIMETSSGQDLNQFFNDWIYNQGFPSYSVQWSQTNPTEIQIQINQTQSHTSVSYFEAPVPLRLIGNGAEQLDIVLDNTLNGELFTQVVPFTVSDVLFDPDFDLISKNNTVTLGLEESTLNELCSIYPNPAQTELHIIKPSGISVESIHIFDVLGKLIHERFHQSSINVSTLSNATYFVKIKTNKGTIHKRVLKQ